eukprot:TRINITY_DN67677_c7_g2_i1.p2 TRINITY_DN67677_c7_g2~~TRINITY_DN67677_c7_g2_i1.p2  ORF type:complete len:118 (+),score=11.12 TRINITY_DN67677_c7_g2_i1:233-586(+)
MNVFLVAFWAEQSARDWKERHPTVTLPILLDATFGIYQAFELGKLSQWKTWHPKTLLHYAKHKVKGGKVLKAFEDVEQRGGDFIITKAGNTVFAKRCETALDRPSVETMLTAVRDNK